MSAASGGDVDTRPPETNHQNLARTMNNQSMPDSRTGTPAWNGAGVSGGTKNRAFAQLIQDEQTEATEKFNYWMELLENASSHAPDFQVSSENMPYLVGRFILAFLDQTKLKYSLLETELSFFQALHYPKIDHLSSQSIQKIKLAYSNRSQKKLFYDFSF